MKQLNSVIDIMKLLEKSNCKECGYPTCMIFAIAVKDGKANLDDCPRISPEVVGEYSLPEKIGPTLEEQFHNNLKKVKAQLAKQDLEAFAKRIDAPYSDGKMTIHVLGKPVTFSKEGKIITDIHLNGFLLGGLINYITEGGNQVPTGNWVNFRDLGGAQSWQAFFEKRVEIPCKRLADADPGFFDTLAGIFSGKMLDDQFDSDVALTLYPFPRVPMMIVYWKSDDGLPSSSNMFFDQTVLSNLSIDYIYNIATGMVMMFEKIALKHHVQF